MPVVEPLEVGCLIMWAALSIILVFLIWRVSEKPNKIKSVIVGLLYTNAAFCLWWIILIALMVGFGYWVLVLFPLGSVGFLASCWMLKKGIL